MGRLIVSAFVAEQAFAFSLRLEQPRALVSSMRLPVLSTDVNAEAGAAVTESNAAWATHDAVRIRRRVRRWRRRNDYRWRWHNWHWRRGDDWSRGWNRINRRIGIRRGDDHRRGHNHLRTNGHSESESWAIIPSMVMAVIGSGQLHTDSQDRGEDYPCHDSRNHVVRPLIKHCVSDCGSDHGSRVSLANAAGVPIGTA